MNRRDRLYVERELKAWGKWFRQGCTFPNALGFNSSTVEHSLMRGETGGSCSILTVPTKFNLDKDIETVQKVFTALPSVEQEPISGVYIYRMKEPRLAIILGVAPHVIRIRLWAGYAAVLEGLSK
jgi:hypothetical protein